jgi:membrane-associated phospholipid phosphatase
LTRYGTVDTLNVVLLVFLGSLIFLLSLFAREGGWLKKLPLLVIFLSGLVIPDRARAQTPDQTPAPTPSQTTAEATKPEPISPLATPAPPVAPPVTVPSEAPATVEPVSLAPEPAYERPVSWKMLYRNVLSDQKQIWTFPARLIHGQYLAPTAAVLGTTAGLYFLDNKEAAYFRNTKTFDGFRYVFNGNATSIGMGVVSASMYAIGRLRKDSKMQRTALLAGEAMIDTAIVQTVLKDATMRLRPVRYPATGWFQTASSPTAYIRGNGSFPSGHSIEAFAVATIIAKRYGNHKWVPYVAYGLATVVGFSRLTLNVHYLSDVAMGGALGYSISRFTVLRQ